MKKYVYFPFVNSNLDKKKEFLRDNGIQYSLSYGSDLNYIRFTFFDDESYNLFKLMFNNEIGKYKVGPIIVDTTYA